MNDDLLAYYNRELTAFLAAAEAFAAEHPDVAAQLRLSSGRIDDPHVERLIEAFAFLTARVQMRLDDDFPELTDALFGILYPHYLAPLPSMAIVQFPPLAAIEGPYRIGRGTLIDTEPVDGTACRFRTASDVTLWPVAIAAATLTGVPSQIPAAGGGGAVASLRLTLRPTAPGLTFARLADDWAKEPAPRRALRFYLRGSRALALALHRLLFTGTRAIGAGNAAGDSGALLMPADALRPVGFAADEALLPAPPQAFAAYRLLTEVFAFPEKFLFIDVALEAGALRRAERTLELTFYLDRTMPELERQVTAEAFALGCTPIVNLFPWVAEAITLDQTLPEYRVEVDDRRRQAFEVHSVDGVRATTPTGEAVDLRPFYATRHDDAFTSGGPRWHAQRRPAADGKPGSETFLTFVDADFRPAAQAGWTASVATTCCNRDLPARLPSGGGRPHLAIVAGGPKDAKPLCLTPPTPTLRPARRDGVPWRLVSHLALNHLSLAGDDEEGGGGRGAAALRRILELYDVRGSPDTRQMIEAVERVSHRRGIARILSQRPPMLVHGIDIRLDFAAERFAGSGLFLLASVLDRFFALYASINAFTRLTIGLTGQPEALFTWPARAGERPLI